MAANRRINNHYKGYEMTDNNNTASLSRRDFLAGLGGLTASAALAGCTLPTPAFASMKGLKLANASDPIHHLAIYPPIGISRVGGSKETFAAPELPGVVDPGALIPKDLDGNLKRQVQRFFIFAFNEKGEVIREVNASQGDQVTWQVRVANTKAAWYGFNNPLNMNQETTPGIPAQLRNDGIKTFVGPGDSREQRLVIDSKLQSIDGNVATELKLGDEFWDHEHYVELATLITNGDGRLQIKPASGISKSVIHNNPIVDFTKNDAWYDDWCDGPVMANVVLKSGSVCGNGCDNIAVKPAWIACVGPNFAPEIPPFTSMHDTIANAMKVKFGSDFPDPHSDPEPKQLSFSKHIYPMFYRLGLMQWVSGAANTRQGWIAVGDFSDVDYIKMLANNSQRAKSVALRKSVFEQFRDPSSDKVEKYKIPYMVGSGVDFTNSPDRWFRMTGVQYRILTRWSKGEFDNDFKDTDPLISCIEDCSLAQQPELLTRAALEPLNGGNFHPGVELTWVLGDDKLYSDEPYRLAHSNRPSLIQDLGPLITVDGVIGQTDPLKKTLGPQAAGDLTRWMGLPWQPDAFSCQNVNYANDFPTVVWWPALLPVDVMPEFAYNQLMRTDLSMAQRRQFASVRVPWARGAAGIGYHANAGYFDGLNRMVYLVNQMGVVLKRRGPSDATDANLLPKEVFVEIGRGTMDLEFGEKPCDGFEPNAAVKPTIQRNACDEKSG